MKETHGLSRHLFIFAIIRGLAMASFVGLLLISLVQVTAHAFVTVCVIAMATAGVTAYRVLPVP